MVHLGAGFGVYILEFMVLGLWSFGALGLLRFRVFSFQELGVLL